MADDRRLRRRASGVRRVRRAAPARAQAAVRAGRRAMAGERGRPTLADAAALRAGARPGPREPEPQPPCLRLLPGPPERGVVSAQDLAPPVADLALAWRGGGL